MVESKGEGRSAARMKPHRGTTILTLGIIGFFCGICGLIALIMGNADLKEMDAGTMDPAGRSNTNTGRICGAIGFGLNVVGILLRVTGALKF